MFLISAVGMGQYDDLESNQQIDVFSITPTHPDPLKKMSDIVQLILFKTTKQHLLIYLLK